jgi:hypothetical protein
MSGVNKTRRGLDFWKGEPMEKDETELGLECCLEVREALAITLADLHPILADKYPISDAAIRHSVATALLFNGVDIYTEESPLDGDDLAELCAHVEFMVMGAVFSRGADVDIE